MAKVILVNLIHIDYWFIAFFLKNVEDLFLWLVDCARYEYLTISIVQCILLKKGCETINEMHIIIFTSTSDSVT